MRRGQDFLWAEPSALATELPSADFFDRGVGDMTASIGVGTRCSLTMLGGDAHGSIAESIFIPTPTFTATRRKIEYRTAMSWKNALHTNAITSGTDAAFRKNIAAGMITAEGAAMIITRTTEAITDGDNLA